MTRWRWVWVVLSLRSHCLSARCSLRTRVQFPFLELRVRSSAATVSSSWSSQWSPSIVVPAGARSATGDGGGAARDRGRTDTGLVFCGVAIRQLINIDGIPEALRVPFLDRAFTHDLYITFIALVVCLRR